MKRPKQLNLLLSLFSFLFCFTKTASSQDTLKKNTTAYTLSAFFDVYYVYDFGKPTGEFRQPFLFNHNRHNELSLNLGFLKASAENDNYRANIALMAGTYSADNYKQEPELFQRLFEFNAGASLNKKNTIWLDAGIFASHIGFESAISKDNYTLTRSLLAETSPYYLTGAKLNYKPGSRWDLNLLLCTGWQRIRPLAGNTLPSLGWQIKYIRKKLSYNWSTFLGTDDPDSLRRMRYFNNFYLQSDFDKGFDFIAGFDIGIQQQKKSSSGYNLWFSPVIIIRYTFSDYWACALRFENFTDKSGVIINHVPSFNANSSSLNIDFSPSKKVSCRIEGRTFHSENSVFRSGKTLSKTNNIISASVAVSL